MAAECTVLIVDRSEDTRETLRIALERRGLRTLAASRTRRGLELARLHRPDLIVLDLDLEGSDPEDTYARFAQASQEHRKPMFVAKPYHYGPLIRRIEEILDATRRKLARCA